MKKILFVLLIVALIFGGAVACSPRGISGNPADEDTGDDEIIAADAGDYEVLAGYLGSFGHVRVLGDIDHILKGEPVDDEAGVMIQSMRLSAPAYFNDIKTELTLPLSLMDYDFDGHRNPEDPEPEKYTRQATGTLDLVLAGAMNAEGTGFVASGYRVENADITLSVDDSVYILLDLPETVITADSISGIFTTKGGVARSAVTVTVADGKAAGIADVNVPKFGKPSGAFTINGLDADFSLL